MISATVGVRSYIAMLIVGAVIPAASLRAQTGSDSASALRLTTCPVEIPAAMRARVQCYAFAVPRDYKHPERGTFDLAVAVRRAERPDAARRPLLMLHGGPGARGFVELTARFPELSPGATMVLFDYRGMGFSAPREVCADIPSTQPEAIAGPGDAFTTAWRTQEPMARCRARLEALGIKAEYFGTRVSSRDADELRRALRIPRWDVYSVSYGTVVARDLLAAYPTGIGSLVLDSPVGFRVASDAGEERTDWTMRNLFSACAADAACAAAHPDFESRYLATFDSVDAHHLLVPIPDAKVSGYPVADINGAEFDLLVRRLRRLPTTMGSIPRIMEAARKRDVAALTPLVTTALARLGDADALGRPSIFCRDEPELHVPRVPRTSLQMTTTMFCGAWGTPGQPPRMPREGSVPVLALVGGLDMIAEQWFLEELKASLGKRLRTVTFPALGHATLSDECARRIAATFYGNPATAPDTTCMVPQPRIVFER